MNCNPTAGVGDNEWEGGEGVGKVDPVTPSLNPPMSNSLAQHGKLFLFGILSTYPSLFSAVFYMRDVTAVHRLWPFLICWPINAFMLSALNILLCLSSDLGLN